MAEITNFKGETRPLSQQDTGEDVVAALMVQVGERVRKTRERKGIPRRVLSEKSGVSPRYLAQLEAGAGNISIGLLERIAVALDHKIEWFVGRDDPWTSDAIRVADLYRGADGNVRQAVFQLLNPIPPEEKRARRICLLGLRGAGKSTLGMQAGIAFEVPFVELNREIEQQGGMRVPEILELYGQDGYRKLEADAIQRVVAVHDELILAVAGGVVADPKTYDILLNHFHTIWIRASPEEHMARVRAQGDERPMTGNPEAMEQLRAILTSRETIYERAQAQLDTTGCSEQQSLKTLLELIKRHNFLA